MPRGKVFTYQGTIIGELHSLVALTVDGTTTEGYFATASEGFFIESAKKYSSRAGDGDKVIYRVEDKVDGDANICGLDETMAEGMKGAGADFNIASSPQIGQRRVLEAATEADKEFVQNSLIGNGDPAKANAHILSVMNQVDAVYRRDLNLRVVVTFQHAWMPGTADPYASFYGSDLLDAFSNYWNVEFPASNPNYHRDVGHLFTLKGGDGMAIMSRICRGTAAAYSFTSINNSNKWVMTAHELGHNLGADHDVYGTIMAAGFNAFATGFSQLSINQITNYINIYGTSCLALDPTATTKTPYDFDGDGKSDISVFRPSNGFWYISKSSGGYSFIQWGQDKDVPVPGDYDGDGKTDLAVFRPGSGSVVIAGKPIIPNYWYILRSSDNTFLARPLGVNSDYDSPVPADYDGDGRTDLAIYTSQDFTPAPGFFIVLQSSTNTQVVTQWGLIGDKPVPADYDGDGRADYAVFRRTNSVWYILQSSDNKLRTEYFGLETDRIASGDYDGDGKTDIAVWRPSSGYWYWINSSDKSFHSFQFGLPSDNPIPADYDGDGKTDIAVFRPLTGFWYLQQSTKGFRAEQFGSSNDTPIPGVFTRY